MSHESRPAAVAAAHARSLAGLPSSHPRPTRRQPRRARVGHGKTLAVTSERSRRLLPPALLASLVSSSSWPSGRLILALPPSPTGARGTLLHLGSHCQPVPPLPASPARTRKGAPPSAGVSALALLPPRPPFALPPRADSSASGDLLPLPCRDGEPTRSAGNVARSQGMHTEESRQVTAPRRPTRRRNSPCQAN